MKIVVFVVLSAHCELVNALYRQHYFINEAKTWSEAQKYCVRNYADLSSADGAADVPNFGYAINTHEMQMANSSSSSHSPFYDIAAWTGLHLSLGYWKWSDGTSVDSGIRFYYIDNVKGCMGFYNDQLYDFSCYNQQPFFCYKWKPELILVKENKTWEDALQHCRTHHNDLASLPTDSHLIQMKQTTANAETNSVWTGLRFLSGTWFWLNGEDLGNRVVLPNCPADPSYCGSRNLKTQSWENRDCIEKRYFVCY